MTLVTRKFKLTHSQQYKEDLGDNFEIVTAFSREGPTKVYVQHRLNERADEINQLLEKKGYFYVCGDASKMAREVNTIMGRIISEKRGLSEAKGQEIVKQMRSSNQYQEVCFTDHSKNAMLTMSLGCMGLIAHLIV